VSLIPCLDCDKEAVWYCDVCRDCYCDKCWKEHINTCVTAFMGKTDEEWCEECNKGVIYRCGDCGISVCGNCVERHFITHIYEAKMRVEEIYKFINV